MITTDDYNFDTNTTVLDNMTDEEAKEYFEDMQADYWIDQMKSYPDLT